MTTEETQPTRKQKNKEILRLQDPESYALIAKMLDTDPLPKKKETREIKEIRRNIKELRKVDRDQLNRPTTI